MLENTFVGNFLIFKNEKDENPYNSEVVVEIVDATEEYVEFSWIRKNDKQYYLRFRIDDFNRALNK
jgi:hypothetical protein